MIPKPLTIHQALRTVNLTHIALLSYYKVKNITARKYVDLGKSGKYPNKRGRPPRTTDAILEARIIHVTGMHASGDIGGAYKLIIMATFDAMVQGTEFEGFSS